MLCLLCCADGRDANFKDCLEGAGDFLNDLILALSLKKRPNAVDELLYRPQLLCQDRPEIGSIPGF